MLYGAVLFKDGSTLEFLELIKDASKGLERIRYRFHYRKSETPIFRYDNAPHHREVATFPHHVHIGEKVLPSKSKSLLDVFKEIESIL
nr:DUF6516 family protein [Archaeoglobus neptunius]